MDEFSISDAQLEMDVFPCISLLAIIQFIQYMVLLGY